MTLKKITKIFLVILCIHFMTITNLAADLSNSQDNALEAYEKISEAFNFRMDILSEDYPDTFAGCYLDGNMLVIQLTDSKDQEIYLEACDYSPYVRFEIKDYSFEDLKSLETEAYETFHMNIIKSYVDVKDNVVVLGIPEEEYQLYQEHQSKSTLPIKVIQENVEKIIADNESISTTNITDTLYTNGNLMKGGEKIYHTYNPTCSMSICFFGTYQNKPALITCGHSNPVGTNISYNGISLGNVLYQGIKKFDSIRNGVILPTSNGDFSIIDISNHSELISDKVLGQNGVSISATKSANVIAGLQVNYYGYMSGYGTATVEHTLVTKELPDPEDTSPYRVLGLVEMSGNATQPGDSGGCVYYKTGAGINRIVGCITSCNRNTLKVCFTPIVHMEEEGFRFN